MMRLPLGRNRRTPVTPASDIAASREAGMRDLLRDTALLVTSLASGGAVPDATSFRQRCRQITGLLAEALERLGYPEDVRREALVAQCGVLDEMALRYLPAAARIDWEQRPMQVERFSIHDAGRRVIDCIETHLQKASPDVDLLECYAAILGMGFVGRYARDGQAKRAALIATLNARLQELRAPTDEPFLTDPAGTQLATGFYRSAPWIIGALACIAAMAVWIAANRTLDTQFAHMTPAKVGQP